MNLIIDVGNTFVKFALFRQNELTQRIDVEHDMALETFETILKRNKSVKKGIISSVGKLNASVFKQMASKLPILIVKHTLHLPFKNLYATPETLGVDRIALVGAAVKQYPSSNVLIIDAGTCITYDFVNQNNDYLGGAISPGIRLRYKSLNNLTANLPLLDTEVPNHMIGNSTASSIHSGVVLGIIKEIDGMIEDYRDEYQDLTVILTGGDANFLSKQLKNSIFANSNFLLEGLNFILEFNSH